MSIDPKASFVPAVPGADSAIPLAGNCSGVYFLYLGSDLVYVGEGWNCLLRVAEHTRKDSDKQFDRWSFLHVEGRDERKALERHYRATLRPRFNRV